MRAGTGGPGSGRDGDTGDVHPRCLCILENLGGAGKRVARGSRREPSLSLQLASLGANWGLGQRLSEETQADY